MMNVLSNTINFGRGENTMQIEGEFHLKRFEAICFGLGISDGVVEQIKEFDAALVKEEAEKEKTNKVTVEIDTIDCENVAVCVRIADDRPQLKVCHLCPAEEPRYWEQFLKFTAKAVEEEIKEMYGLEVEIRNWLDKVGDSDTQ